MGISNGHALLATPDLLSRAVFGDRLVTLPPGFSLPDDIEGGATLPDDPNHRLGRYFERLVEEGIRALGPVRFHAGLVVREGKTTLGELDFVFQLPGEDFARHWEISCKYYLGIAGQSSAPSGLRFVGLMTRDRLDLKIPKIMDVQLSLPQRPAAHVLLDSFGYPDRVVSQAWVKGILFYNRSSYHRTSQGPLSLPDLPTRPVDLLVSAVPSTPPEVPSVPPGVSPDHWRGRWSVGIPPEYADARWVDLQPKTRWLIPYRAPLSTPTLSSAQVHAEPYAMLARVEAQETSEGGEWFERERICVVPPDWPARALAAQGDFT